MGNAGGEQEMGSIKETSPAAVVTITAGAAPNPEIVSSAVTSIHTDTPPGTGDGPSTTSNVGGTRFTMTVAVAVGVDVGVGVGVGVDVGVNEGVSVAVRVAVSVAVCVAVGVEVSVAVLVSVGVGDAVGLAVAVGVLVAVGVGVHTCGLLVGAAA